MNLADEAAFVTGAGSGIGRAVALRLAVADAKVVGGIFSVDGGYFAQ